MVQFPKLTARRSLVLSVAATLAAAGSLFGTGALASTRHRLPSAFAAISVLKHAPTMARLSRADEMAPHALRHAIGAAVLASQSPLARWASTDSSTNMGLTPNTTVTLIAAVDGAQVYSYVTADGSLCMMGVNPVGDPDAGGGNCAHRGPADLDGNSYAISADKLFPQNVAVELVPNGVSSVTFSDSNTGATTQVPVVNNVAVDVSADTIVGTFTNAAGQSFTGVTAESMAAAAAAATQ